MACVEFQDRVLNDLLPQFCEDPSKPWGPEGFKAQWDRITDHDALDFLRGLDAGLIKHVGRGLYLAPKSAAKEMFFWTGSTKVIPRPITLWAEPIITVAALARLHFDLGWPPELIGTQSKDWAFDLVTFENAGSKNEYIAGEVKKSAGELDQMITYMTRFGGNPRIERPDNAKELNAYKKVAGLLLRRAALFWAVGPNAKGHAFKVVYGDDGLVEFQETTVSALSYSPCSE